jgi:hypothetical protein
VNLTRACSRRSRLSRRLLTQAPRQPSSLLKHVVRRKDEQLRCTLMVATTLALLWTGAGLSDDLPFVLLMPAAEVPTEDATISSDAAFAVARSYGLDPAVGRISVQLCVEDPYGLFWKVAYIDWSAVEGTNAFYIDAKRGVIVGNLVTVHGNKKQRREFEVDPEEAKVDHWPPAAPEVRFAGAKRGYYPNRPCLMKIEVENARRGIIEAYILNLSDDRTRREDMGFVLEQVGGAHPLPDSWMPKVAFYPQIKFHPDSLMVFISWDDGNDDIQEPVSTSFAVWAVDKAGNRSACADTLVVELPGG